MVAVLVFLLVILLGELIVCIESKNKARGLMMGIVLTMLCTIVNISLIKNGNAQKITYSFCLYYLIYAWIFYAVYIFTYYLGHGRRAKFYKSPVFYTSLAQSAIIFSHYFNKPIFTVRKTIAFGINWWMAYGRKTNAIGGWFAVYKMLSIAAIVIIAVGLIRSVKTTPRIYRSKLYSLAIAQIFYGIFTFTMNVRSYPVVLISILMTPISAIGLYYALYYRDRRFKDRSLVGLADKLSEGFILYNDEDKLIYVSGYVKQMLPDDLIKTFESITELRIWNTDYTMLNGIQARKVEKDGEAYYYDVVEDPIMDSGIRIGTLFDYRNITNSAREILIMEQINDELERTSAMKADFLANMSHELRTPMNAVIGMAELVLREQISPQAEEYVRQIKNSGSSLLDIINDILDYSKIESGKMDITPDEYDPSELFQDVLNTLQVRAEKKNIELQCHFDPSIPRKLKGDASRIRQILINITNNGIKFTNEGRVLVTVESRKIDPDTIGLSVHCKDTGIGIKSNDLKKLFTSFTQVDSKRNRNVEGTGLGLAISKSLVEAMGGQIGVDSEYGVGSDFYFEIPQKIVDDAPSINPSNITDQTILCVTENPQLVKFLKESFESIGLSYYFYDKMVPDVPEADAVITDELHYDSLMEEYVTGRPNLKCGIITNLNSPLASSLHNVRILRRPITTIRLDKFANNLENMDLAEEREEDFKFDFVAPDAHVLIVDDNQVNLSVASGLIEPLNMHVDTAESGKIAIDLASKTKYDIIFMDHMMPEMDGVETTKYLRENEPNAKDTPIIALSANAVPEARELFLSSGMNDFVPKPIELKTIVKKVKEWLPDSKIVGQEPAEAAEASDEEIVIEGIDVKAALGMMGSSALYKKILKDYYGSIDRNYDELLNCINTGDYENYTIKIHALKSSSRQIGAMELATMSEKLEHSSKAGDIEYVQANYEGALEEYRRVQSILTPALDSMGLLEKPVEKKAFDGEAVKGILDELATACDELDMDGMEKASDDLNAMEAEGEIADLIGQLVEVIGMMDVDRCAEISDSLRALL